MQRRRRWIAAVMSLGVVLAAGAGTELSGAPAASASAASVATQASASIPTSTARKPARLLVTAEEWRYRLSRPKLRANKAVIQLYNRGEDVHDLRMRRIGRLREVGTPEIAPGDVGVVRTRLRRGRYSLWCAIPGHRAKGMEATLKVRKRR